MSSDGLIPADECRFGANIKEWDAQMEDFDGVVILKGEGGGGLTTYLAGWIHTRLLEEPGVVICFEEGGIGETEKMRDLVCGLLADKTGYTTARGAVEALRTGSKLLLYSRVEWKKRTKECRYGISCGVSPGDTNLALIVRYGKGGRGASELNSLRARVKASLKPVDASE